MSDLFPNGCNWIVGTSTKGVGPTKTVHNVFCNKICEPNQTMCPKHTLMEQEAVEKLRAFPKRMQSAKKWKKERLEALAASPLAAHNPRFDIKPKAMGGMDAEEENRRR